VSFWGTASEDLQGGGVFSVVVGLYDDLHVLIEGDEEAEKALHGEPAEVSAQHLGDIGSHGVGLSPVNYYGRLCAALKRRSSTVLRASVRRSFNSRSRSKVKGSGQECPLHTWRDGNKQVPFGRLRAGSYRTWRPVRNDKEFGADRQGMRRRARVHVC